MNCRIKRKSIKIAFLLSLYYLILFWVYQNLIGPQWSYRGFNNELSFKSLILSLIGFLFAAYTFITINKRKAPSAMIMNLFDLFFFIPIYIFIAFNQVVIGFQLFVFIYHFTLFLLYTSLKIPIQLTLKRRTIYFKYTIAFFLILTLFINGYYNGFKVKLNLVNIYDNRLEVREMSIPSIFNYIKASSYLVGIIALTYAMKIRNWLLITAIIIIQLMSFAFGSSKTQFFSIFICIIAFSFYSDRFRLWAPVSLIALLVMAIMEFKAIGSTLISDIAIRRVLFVPSKISYNMYEFFEAPGREYLYLRGSILRFLGFEDPYATQEGFQRMIGEMYGGSENTNANTGLLGNDYAQFGWWSILIYPFLRVLTLKIYDYCAIGIDIRVTITLSIFIAFLFISGSFFTVLVTNGILLVCFLLYSYPRNNPHVKTIN
jgi:hypothetical protein